MNSRGPRLLTLTGNLLAERTWSFAAWAAGRTQRAARETFQVGGKGVNVSKMLNRLGVPNTALVFTGGAAGAECLAWLEDRGFDHRSFPAESPTRAGLVVRAEVQTETTFLGPDSPPGPAAVRACAEFLEAQPDGGVLAVCGSLPGWTESYFDPLRASLVHWTKRGALCADTYGPPLAWLSGERLALIKINRTEFESLAGGSPGTPSEVAADLQFRPRAAKGRNLPRRSSRSANEDGRAATSQRGPVEAWIVTDGPRPVWVVDGSRPPEKLTPPPVREISPTGSGDVLLACVLHARFHQGLGWAQAAAFALPYAAANAAHEGVADFELPG